MGNNLVLTPEFLQHYVSRDKKQTNQIGMNWDYCNKSETKRRFASLLVWMLMKKVEFLRQKSFM